MKVFMVTWGVLCFLVIVGLIITYAADNFPGIPATQSRAPDVWELKSEDPDKSGQVVLEVDENCSPCEENLKRLKKAMEQAARERQARKNQAQSDRLILY